MTTRTPRITRIQARNFRSLAAVDVELRPLSVLIGPNGSGKTNLLNVLRFLAATARYDLGPAIEQWGGVAKVQRQADGAGAVRIVVHGQVTQQANTETEDIYRLTLQRRAGGAISRGEEFSFTRRNATNRRITVSGDTVTISDDGEERFSRRLASRQTTSLATLPRFSDDEGGLGIRDFTELLSTLRLLDPDVSAARRPSRELDAPLASDASNLADALARLFRQDAEAFSRVVEDLARCLPGLLDVRLSPRGGAGRSVAVELVERGVSEPIELADASFGTVRLLALLTALHEPEPPAFTAIEEIDHGLHPYALDILVDRMRTASNRTQILVATHSPTLVNRLTAEEIIVCDRDSRTGESVIPAMTAGQIRAALTATDLHAGELWFAGAISGVPA